MMTPEESLNLISNIIQEAKERQQENGNVYLFWGGITAILGLAHYALIVQDLYEFIFVPYLSLTIAAMLSYFLFQKQWRQQTDNVIAKTLRTMWIIVGINLIFIGFMMPGILGPFHIPVILLLHSIAIMVSGTVSRNPILQWGGIIGNVIALGCFWIQIDYQPLVMSAESLITSIIPGIVLHYEYRQRRTA